MTRIVTALFKDRAAAERAWGALRGIGIPDRRIGLHADPHQPAQPATRDSIGGESGLVGLLDMMLLSDADFAAHREALRRGGFVVSAEVGEAEADRVARALEGAGAADLDAEERAWRKEGWSPAAMAGAVSSDPGSTPAMMPGTGGMDAEAARMLAAGSLAANTIGDAAPVTRMAGEEDPRRLARREPDLGRARSYVIEAPLAEEPDPSLGGDGANDPGNDPAKGRGAA